MYIATGPRITVATGVLAIFLAAISPAGTWTAEPVKQEKKAKKPAQARTSAFAPKATAPKFASAETAGKAPFCFGEAPKLDKLTPDEGKAGDKVTITGTSFGAAACLRGVSFGPVVQLNFNRPTTASQRSCQEAERRAWSSSPSPPPREKTQDRSS